jgi:hypothetical protein
MHVNLLVWISVVLSCHHAGCTHKSTSRHQLVSELFALGGLVVGAVDVMHMLSQHVLSSAAAFFWGGGGVACVVPMDPSQLDRCSVDAQAHVCARS